MSGTKLFNGILIIGLLSLMFTGCATKEKVMEEVQASEDRQSREIAGLRQELTAEINKIDGAEQKSGKAERDSAEALKAIERLRADFSARSNLLKKMEENVYFGFDKHDLDDGARTSLDQVADLLNRDSNSVAVIEGHTDSRGSESYNYSLSYRRIGGVIGYLIAEKGVALNRIHLVGLGEGYPATNNSSEAGRSQNRRVAIKVMAPR